MCILYSLSEIRFFPPECIHQDFPVKKKTFLSLTFLKFIPSFSSSFKTMTWNACIQRMILQFLAPRMLARHLYWVRLQHRRWRSPSRVCQSQLHFYSDYMVKVECDGKKRYRGSVTEGATRTWSDGESGSGILPIYIYPSRK